MKCPLCGSNMHEAFGRMICDNPNCHYMQYRRSKKKQSKKPKQKSIKRKTIKKKVNKMIKKYPKCVGSKIRSKGKGQGLGRGKGKGPIGRPYKKKK